MTDKLKEDTVSADRKERIIFDPEAWRKSDKSGRKTSAITSRQNFDNEKFTRKAKSEEQVDEGTIQPSGDSKVDSAGPTQSDMISKDTKPKKSNNPQIEFVTGTVNPNGSSSTSQGNQPMTGRKISEALIEKAIKQVKRDAGVPFDGPYTKTPDVVVDKSGAKHTAYSRARDLARKALANQIAKKGVKEETELAEGQYAGLEKEDKPGKKATEFKGSKGSVTGKTVEGWKDEKIPVKEEHENLEEGRGYNHNDNRTGFGKRPREDDEYHVPDPVDNRQTHTIKMKLSRDGGEVQHKQMNVKTLHGAEHAKKFAHAEAQKQGWTVHEEVQHVDEACKEDKKKKQSVKKEETLMSKTYNQFMEELDSLVEFVPEAIEEGIKIKTATGYIHKGTRGYGNDNSEFDQNDDFDSDDKPKAKPADAPKRGRGRPSGSYGTYKARSAETKAAAAAKSAATKAANKAK